MKLYELEVGEKLTIQVRIKGHTLEYETAISYVMEQGVLLKAVLIEGKTLGFHGEGVVLNLVYSKDEQIPEIWRGVQLPTVEYKGEKYYRCMTEQNSAKINRRGAYRVSVTEPGIAVYGSNNRGVRITMRDLSETGFSFFTDDYVVKDITEKTQIRITFNTEKNRFNLAGVVVRTKDRLVCCKMLVPNQIVSRFIAECQREKMSMKRRLDRRTATMSLVENDE